MAIEAGRRLGPYEIVSPLGVGGMGEVYRAKDTRLDRMVALKVLSEQLANTPEAKLRFEREARAISSLNHPCICTLYDVGQDEGRAFLIMELVEGETLAERLKKGPLPMNEVARVGREIAEALAAAHKAGVVHRDLKPGNVMLTRFGPKLLDFGLARMLQSEGPGAAAAITSLPTADAPLTADGALLGTWQYMAPEQLEGKLVDARADIFALGVVLYEMATGRRAFSGTSRAGLVASILTSEPPSVSTTQPLAAPAFDHVVRLCMAKDPEARWQSTQDVAAVLALVEEGATAPGKASSGSRASRVSGALLLLAVALASAALGALGARLGSRARGASLPIQKRLSVNFPAGAGAGSYLPPALSPDGSSVVFAATREGTKRLYQREMGQLEARPLPHTEGADMPFFSPDGQWLGFVADGKLQKMLLAGGGEPRVLCDAPDSRGASWGDGDTIVFSRSGYEGLFRVSAAGGRAEALTELGEDGDVLSHRWPQLLPGGKAAIFATITKRFDEEGRDILAVSLETRRSRVLVKGALFPRFLAPGYLLYGRGGLVLAAPFDPVRLELTGPAVVVLEGVGMFPKTAGNALFDASPSGALVYVPGYLRAVERSLVFVDRRGRARPATPTRRPFVNPALSPDGRRVAVTIESPTTDDLWIGDLARDTWDRLTAEGDNHSAAWTPDGKGLVFNSSRGGALNLFWAPVSGGGAAEPLTKPETGEARLGWGVSSVAPNGKTLAFATITRATGGDIFTVERGNPASVRALVATPANEVSPCFSPDGRFLAYSSNQSGRSEVYVRAFAGRPEALRVSRDGGGAPIWASSGREIFYRAAGHMMAVVVATTPELRAEAPEALFQIPASSHSGVVGRNYDVSADAQHFLMVQGSEPPPDQLVVVPEFRDELRARLAAAPRQPGR